jgi:hypothetical protein
MAIITPPDLPQGCLDKLRRALDLVLKTAEAASAANDHKLVIQSAREVTRLAALIHKMTGSKTRTSPARRAGQVNAPTAAPSASAREAFLDLIGQTEQNPAESFLPDLKSVFTPKDMVFWDTVPDHDFQELGDKYQKLRELEKTAAAELQTLKREQAPPVSPDR